MNFKEMQKLKDDLKIDVKNASISQLKQLKKKRNVHFCPVRFEKLYASQFFHL